MLRLRECDPHRLYEALRGVVNTSMSGVDIGNLTSHIYKITQTVFDSATSTASASEEMLSTVQGIATNAEQAANLAQHSRVQVQAAVNNMQGIQTDMQHTVESIQRLEHTSGEIQEILKTINDISNQTNLLALNAAIESARAGDAGRGFAVVADEVRKLSIKTQQSTEEITRMVQQIQVDVSQAVSSVQKSQTTLNEGSQTVQGLQESSGEIEHLMGSIARSIQEQSLASQQISEGISYVSESAGRNLEQSSEIMRLLDAVCEDIEGQRAKLATAKLPNKVLLLAQADHALWKKKIIDFEMGRIDLKPEDAGDHTMCRLGQWYYGEGQKFYSGDELFKQMEAAHVRVHASAKEAVERRQRDPRADISDLINKLNASSDEVVAALQTLEKRAQQG